MGLFHMYLEQWIIVLSLLGGVVFGLAAAVFRIRRLRLAMPAVLLFLVSVYWEKTVSAPIRLDMFPEIALMILCLIFGTWQTLLCRRKKQH